MRHTIKLGVMIVAVVAVVMSGLAFAQTDDSEPTETYQSHLLGQLAPLVEDGTITQDQANAIADNFTERFSDRLEQRRERFEQRRAFHQEVLDLLGMTAEELRAAISDGMTLADVATGQGVAVDDVVGLLVSQAEQRIAQAVDNGRLTPEEADDKLADVTPKITDKVNDGGGFGRRGHRGGAGRGFGGGPGFGGPGFGGPGPGGHGAPATDAVNA